MDKLRQHTNRPAFVISRRPFSRILPLGVGHANECSSTTKRIVSKVVPAALVVAILACGATGPKPIDRLEVPHATVVSEPEAPARTTTKNNGSLYEAMRLVVIDEVVGSYLLRVGISPTDPTEGYLQVSVLVLDLQDGSPVDDATVRVSAFGSGTPGQVEAASSPQHPGLYEGNLTLDDVGDWQISLEIDSPKDIVRLSKLATHTFRIRAQSKNVTQNSGVPNTQTLSWEFYNYTLYVDAPLVLQRRFHNLVSFWSEIASRNARPQSCRARGRVAMKRCSRSLSCELSL